MGEWSRSDLARFLRFCHPRGRCAFFFPSPLGGRGEGEGGPLAPPRASGCVPPSPFDSACAVRPPLSLILSPVGGEEPARGRARLSRQAQSGLARPLIKAIRAPARMALPCPCAVPPLLSSSRAMRVLLPSPLGGRGKGEGGRWRHLEPLGASPPLPSTPLARSVPPLLDPLPRRGRGIRKVRTGRIGNRKYRQDR